MFGNKRGVARGYKSTWIPRDQFLRLRETERSLAEQERKRQQEMASQGGQPRITQQFAPTPAAPPTPASKPPAPRASNLPQAVIRMLKQNGFVVRPIGDDEDEVTSENEAEVFKRARRYHRGHRGSLDVTDLTGEQEYQNRQCPARQPLYRAPSAERLPKSECGFNQK